MEPIAIIGLSCRFPGADNPEAFWQLLRDGRSVIREVPADRWDLAEFYDNDPSAAGRMYTRWGGFLDHLDRFDAAFFGISAREAERIDPQQRLLLELCWEALEDAGHVPARLKGTRTGVFIAFCIPEYQLAQMAQPRCINSYTNTGYLPCIVSNRLSYVFDFRGPSVSLDTACSGSLVALHLACQSLRSGESTLALAGGVNLMVSPVTTIGYSKLGILSPDRECRAFDARANGYVRGEGGGMLLLKPLAAALADGDEIHAVIRGEAVNQDGRSNGLTAPNRFAQEEVVREAYQRAGVSPREVSYVEAHGTGTLMGDSIEARALGTVLGSDRANGSSCAIGSVKTNVGHLESAAGIASLLKVVLALKHRMIPASLHFETPNPHIPFQELGLTVQRTLAPWPDVPGPAVAGVHAYGFGGTNAHFVLEAAPANAVGHAEREPSIGDTGASPTAQLLTISASNLPALRALAESYGQLLRGSDQDAMSLADVCHTAALHRSHQDYRLSVIGYSGQEVVERLDRFIADRPAPGMSFGRNTHGRRPKIAFLFTGQGSQYAAMGRTLHEMQPVFRETLDECDRLLQPYLPQSLLSVLYSDSGSSLNETAYTQPALFALEYSLAQLWKSWGIEPDVVLGHSVGEYVAACVAGVFSLQDGLKLIARRGQLMQDLPRDGDMAAVFANAELVRAAMEPFAPGVSLAAINGPEEVTISGVRQSVDAVLEVLKAEGIAVKKLTVSHAFHSSLMDPILDPFERTAGSVSYAPPRVTLISNVTGRAVEGVLDASYWRNHVRQPVLFSDGIRAVRDLGARWLVEIGPHPTLLDLAKRGMPHDERPTPAGDSDRLWLPSLRRGRNDREQILESLGALYSHGLDVNWSGLYRTPPRRHVKLPTYPFQRERCWFVAEKETQPRSSAGPNTATDGPVVHPLLGHRLRSAAVIFESQFGGRQAHYLEEHHVFGVSLVPGAAYLEMALAAARESFPTHSCRIDDVVFYEPLLIGRETARTVQFTLAKDGGHDASFHVSSLDPHPDHSNGAQPHSWKRHVTGMLRPADGLETPGAPTQLIRSVRSLDEARDQCRQPLDVSEFYARLSQQGLEYGERFRGVHQLWSGKGEALGLVRVHERSVTEASDYHFHPALLDSCFQVVAAALPADARLANGQDTYLPLGLESFRLHRPPGGSVWSHAILRRPDGTNGETFGVDIRIYEPSGELAAEVDGLVVKRARRAQVERSLDRPNRDWFHEFKWRRRSLEDSSTADPVESPSSWLILADRGGTGAALAERLGTRDGNSVTTLLNGAANDQEFQGLLEKVAGDCRNGSLGIVHCWSLDCPSSKDLTLESLQEAQALSCGSALQLVQALHKLEAGVPLRLWLVTRGAQAVDGPSTSIAVAQAPLWGLARTIHWEHAELHCTIVDLDPEDPNRDPRLLHDELRAPGQEGQVAYRGGGRFVPRLIQRRGRASDDSSSTRRDISIHADATYMISGGMGGLGLRVAGWLVEQGARNLVLIGRREPSAGARQDIEALEALANVAVAQVDMSDPEQTTRLFAEVRAALPPLRGIIHAAGVLDNGLLTKQSPARFDVVAAPKLSGAWNLHLLSRETPLDFFVMFSSATSLLGSPGQGTYAAANAFLDTLAHYRHANNLPASSINWGPWAEVGMAAAVDEKARARFDGITPIQPQQGMQILAEVLRSRAPQTVAVLVDWPRFLERFSATAEPVVLSELAGERQPRTPTGPSAQGRPRDWKSSLDAVPPTQRQDVLIEHLHRHVISAMKLETTGAVDVRRPLAELGMDSLTAVELRNTLAAAVDRPLPASLLFDYPSIEALAKYLAKEVFACDARAATVTAQPSAPATARTVNVRYDDMSDEELAVRLAEKLASRASRKIDGRQVKPESASNRSRR